MDNKLRDEIKVYAATPEKAAQFIVANFLEHATGPNRESALCWAKQLLEALRMAVIKECDAELNKLGLKLLSQGDKHGWSICDDAGHILRALLDLSS
jgi:hypothetical protein